MVETRAMSRGGGGGGGASANANANANGRGGGGGKAARKRAGASRSSQSAVEEFMPESAVVVSSKSTANTPAPAARPAASTTTTVATTATPTMMMSAAATYDLEYEAALAAANEPILPSKEITPAHYMLILVSVLSMALLVVLIVFDPLPPPRIPREHAASVLEPLRDSCHDLVPVAWRSRLQHEAALDLIDSSSAAAASDSPASSSSSSPSASASPSSASSASSSPPPSTSPSTSSPTSHARDASLPLTFLVGYDADVAPSVANAQRTREWLERLVTCIGRDSLIEFANMTRLVRSGSGGGTPLDIPSVDRHVRAVQEQLRAAPNSAVHIVGFPFSGVAPDVAQHVHSWVQAFTDSDTQYKQSVWFVSVPLPPLHTVRETFATAHARVRAHLESVMADLYPKHRHDLIDPVLSRVVRNVHVMETPVEAKAQAQEATGGAGSSSSSSSSAPKSREDL